MPDGAVTSPSCRTPRRRPGVASESHRDRSDRGCRDPAPAHRACTATHFVAEDVDQVFGTDGALALAPLGQPEIGVRMVELGGDMHRLKLGIGRSIAGTVCRIAVRGSDCACKEAVVLLASVPHLSGTTKPFSTADVMKAGKTARFFTACFFPHKSCRPRRRFPPRS